MTSKTQYFELNRRRFMIAASGLGLSLAMGGPRFALAADQPLSVGALFAGQVEDGGFMESGYRGLLRAERELGVQTRYIDGIPPEKERLAAALRELASSGVDLVIAHGGQNNEAAATIAAEFPEVRFVVTQGSVTADNLASYEVLQEQSAWLAGALAGLLTQTNVVGHMSGIRVRPGLKGRAAYADGVRTANPDAKLLTNFSGNQDDNALSHRIATAEIEAGADIIFTMLNAGRNGVTEACREHGVRQIGNVVDWVQIDPEVFVASAIADVSIGVFNAVSDVQSGVFEGNVIHRIGLENEEAVRLTMAVDVPTKIAERIAGYAEAIRNGEITVPEDYDGPEFEPSA